MTKLHNDYYTYAYLREDKTPYYIGKGRGKRAYDKRRAIKPPTDKSRILFLKKNLTEAEAFKHEVYMIFVLGRKDLGTGILRNRTKGGDGASGAVRSAETRKKVSVANTGKTHTEAQKKAQSEKLTGRTHTEKAKKKMSDAMSGENNPQYGNTGALSSRSKAVIAIQPDGTELRFGGVRESARELGINPGNLSTYSKTGNVLKWGKFKDWRFVYKNP